MNWNDCIDIDILMQRKKNIRLERGGNEDDRKEQIFFNRCLREVDGRDAYDYLTFKASKLLDCSMSQAYRFTNYYFENKEHFDCSFEDWLLADNGPLYRSSIYGLFPEFEAITKDEYEIAKMAREYYGIEIYHVPEWEGYGVYSMEFNFKELNAKRVDMKVVKETVKDLILKELE